MTNHLRTLLLNMAAGDPADPVPGEGYVPPTFRPVTLPAALDAARKRLFGRSADRAGVNANLARLLAFLHASPLAADVTAYDPRIAYDTAAPADAWAAIGPSAVTVSGGDVVGWAGTPTFGQEGRALGRWAVAAEAGGVVRAVQIGGGAGYVSADPDTGAADSWSVPLPGSDTAVLVPSGADGAWRITLYVPPTYCFTAAAAAPDPDAVFRPSRGGRETAWNEAWGTAPTAAERAGAYALALAARIDVVRTTGRGD